MERSEQIRFDKLYQKHLTALKLQGKSKSTIDLYSRPLRRLAAFFDRCPDRFSPDDLKPILPLWWKVTPGVSSKLTVMACCFSGNTY